MKPLRHRGGGRPRAGVANDRILRQKNKKMGQEEKREHNSKQEGEVGGVWGLAPTNEDLTGTSQGESESKKKLGNGPEKLQRHSSGAGEAKWKQYQKKTRGIKSGRRINSQLGPEIPTKEVGREQPTTERKKGKRQQSSIDKGQQRRKGKR